MVGMDDKQCDGLSFLDLPGEIRNKIYNHLFSGQVLITRNYPARARRKGQDSNAGLPRPKVRLRLSYEQLFSLDKSSGEMQWTPPCVLRVCRLIYEEATTCLYANTTFRFDSMLTIHKFLNVAPAEGVKAILKLELQHRTYGEPKLMEHRKWKQRHDKKWFQTCRRISGQMTGIEELRIDLQICDWPTQLNLAAAWAKPLMLLKAKGRIEVSLHHEAFSEQRLQATSRVVSKAMMNEHTENVAKLYNFELRGGDLESKAVQATDVLSVKPTTCQLTDADVIESSPAKRSTKTRLLKLSDKHDPHRPN